MFKLKCLITTSLAIIISLLFICGNAQAQGHTVEIIERDGEEFVIFKGLTSEEAKEIDQALEKIKFDQKSSPETPEMRQAKEQEDLESSRKIGEENYNIGMQYVLGNSSKGVKQDFAKAASKLKIAARHRDIRAQLMLGTMYLNGKGVSENPKEAAILFRKAAVQKGPFQSEESRLIRGDSVSVEREYLDIRAHAQNELGQLYVYGKGVPQDFSEGEKWIRKAADHGHALAQNNLGILYAYGKGVPQDFSKAKEWIRKAITGGDKTARSSLKQVEQAERNGGFIAGAAMLFGGLMVIDALSSNDSARNNTNGLTSQESNSAYEACWSRVYKEKIATCRASFVSLACDHSGCVRKFDCDKRGFSGCNRVLGPYENWDKYYCNTDNRDYSHDLATVINKICLK